MKHLLLAAMLLGVSICNAQDILVFKNGDEVKAKISEVGVSEIKYKKFDNLTGPTYTSLKSDVFMIKYENGTKDVFGTTGNTTPPINNTTPSTNNTAPSTNNTAPPAGNTAPPAINTRPSIAYDNNYRPRSKRYLTAGGILTGFGCAFIISGAVMYGVSVNQASSYLNTGNGDPLSIEYLAIGGITSMCISIPFIISGPIMIAKGKRAQRNERNTSTSLSFEPSGLRLTF